MAEAIQSVAVLVHDRAFVALTLWAERRVSLGPRVFIYDFNHAYPVQSPKALGAFPTAEVSCALLDTLNTSGVPFASRDHRAAGLMRAHWITFMRRDDPNLCQVPHRVRRLARGKFIAMRQQE